MYAAAARPLMMVAQICGREGWAIEDAHASMLRRRYIEVPVRWLQGMGPRSHTTGSLGKRDFCMSFALFEKTQGPPGPGVMRLTGRSGLPWDVKVEKKRLP